MICTRGRKWRCCPVAVSQLHWTPVDGFAWPATGEITSRFGMRISPIDGKHRLHADGDVLRCADGHTRIKGGSIGGTSATLQLHIMPHRPVEEAIPLEVRVVERWFTDEAKAIAALEYIESLVRHLAMRKIVQRTEVQRRQRSSNSPERVGAHDKPDSIVNDAL
jgi:hypothetical protein